MGYEQSVSSQKRLVGLFLVVILHVVLIYALINGLAQDFVKKIVHDPLEVSVIDEVKLPPPPPPPPPPKNEPIEKVVTPPAYVPPAEVRVQSTNDNNSISAVSNEVPAQSTVAQVSAPAPAPVAEPPPPKHIPVKQKAMLNTGCIAPKYPADSLDNEEEGQVIWSFLVDVDGHVSESKLVKSSGFSSLDQAAKLAFIKCQFSAATSDGVPEKSWVQQPFEWKIK